MTAPSPSPSLASGPPRDRKGTPTGPFSRTPTCRPHGHNPLVAPRCPVGPQARRGSTCSPSLQQWGTGGAARAGVGCLWRERGNPRVVWYLVEDHL